MFKAKERPVRLRTAIVIESGSQKDLEEALNTASGLAKAKVLLMSFGSKRKDGPTISVRTTTLRKKIIVALHTER